MERKLLCTEVILLVVLLSNSSLALKAYDCEDPDYAATAYSAPEANSCKESMLDFNPKGETVFGQIVRTTYQEGVATVYSCFLQKSIHVVYCMHWIPNYRAAYNNLVEELVVPIDLKECKEAVKRGNFTYEGKTFKFEDNEVVKESYYQYGHENDDGSCTGSDFTYRGKSYPQHFVRTSFVMTFDEQVQEYDTGTGMINIEPYQIRGNIDSRGLHDVRYGTFVWSTGKAKDFCYDGVSELHVGPLTLYKHKYGYKDSYIQVHNKTAGMTMVSKLKEATFLCGRRCFTTTTPNLILCDVYHGNSSENWSYSKLPYSSYFVDIVAPKTNITLASFMEPSRKRFNFLQVKAKLCQQEQGMIEKTRRLFNQNSLSGNMNVIGPGKLIRRAGAILYVIHCKPVEVQVKKAGYEKCTLEIPVVYKEKLQFVEPVNAIIQRKPTVIDCSLDMPVGWQIYGKWTCFADNLKWPCIIPKTFDPHMINSVEPSYAFYKDHFLFGGTYGAERWQKKMDVIGKELSAPATLNYLIRNVTNVNGYIPEGAISVPRFGAIVDVAGIENILSLNFFGGFSHLFKWFFYFLLFKALCDVIGWIVAAVSRIRLIYYTHGISPILLCGFSEGLFHYVAFRPTSRMLKLSGLGQRREELQMIHPTRS